MEMIQRVEEHLGELQALGLMSRFHQRDINRLDSIVFARLLPCYSNGHWSYQLPVLGSLRELDAKGTRRERDHLQ
jgi:hypothetical protein